MTEREVAFLAALGIVLGLFAGMLWYGRRTAEDAVLIWEVRVGLPRDESAHADAVQRRVRRISAGHVGGFIGLMAGILGFVLDPGMIGLACALICGLAGATLATWRWHAADLRERSAQARSRAATLRRRRLLDYLTPSEVFAPYIVLGVTEVMVVVLVTHTPQTDRAIALLVVAVLGGALFVAAQVLQRRALRLVHPAGSASEMRWEEAQRAVLLRELTGLAVMSPFLLTCCVSLAVSLEWLRGPGWLDHPLQWVQIVALYLTLWTIGVGSRRKALQRSQRQFEMTEVG